MKLSKYIVEVHNEMGHLLTNLYSGSDLFLNNEQYEEYRKIISDLSNNASSELYECLRSQLFVIEDTYDECAVMKLKRNVAIFNMNPSDVKFVIAPTLACNARCAYCYEKDISAKKTMSLATADELVKFIQKNANGRKRINISWFGGEPLLNTDVIEYVSKNIISFAKKMVLNFMLI